MLLIENSGMQRQTGAAVESFRNEMVKANETSLQVLAAAAGIGSRTINNDSNLIDASPNSKSIEN
jgi:hypothetical protein